MTKLDIFDISRHFATFLEFLMRRSRCWWVVGLLQRLIGKTQHFTTFLDISRRVVAAGWGGPYWEKEYEEIKESP